MNIASRFITRPNAKKTVSLRIDGERVSARPDDTIAAVLLTLSGDAIRHTAKGSSRTAYCMMGVCFDCLVEVDGRPNTQACMVTVREGMVIRRQYGLRKLIVEEPINE